MADAPARRSTRPWGLGRSPNRTGPPGCMTKRAYTYANRDGRQSLVVGSGSSLSRQMATLATEVTWTDIDGGMPWDLGPRGSGIAAVAHTALADLPAAYNRARGYGLAQFGSALVAANEPDRAVSVTSEALSIARGCGSGRTMRRIRAVGGSLSPHAKLPSVARLLDELAAAG